MAIAEYIEGAVRNAVRNVDDFDSRPEEMRLGLGQGMPTLPDRPTEAGRQLFPAYSTNSQAEVIELIDLTNIHSWDTREQGLARLGILIEGDKSKTDMGKDDPNRARTPLSNGEIGTLIIDTDNLGAAAAALPPKSRI